MSNDEKDATNDDAATAANETVNNTNSRKKKLKKSKTKRKAELRKKNLGLGIGTIDVNANATASTKSKKIRFDDDFVLEKEDLKEGGDKDEAEEHSEEKKAINSGADDDNEGDDNDDDDDDDDVVEQVSSSVARNEALQLRAAERETRMVESAITQKRKRKKKIIVSKDVGDDEELDEEFLAMVDTAREDDARLKTLQQQSKPQLSLGRHTTFVSDENDASTTKTVHADHNIEVVVLPSGIGNENDDDDNNGSDRQANIASLERSALALSSGLSTQPSKTAMLFCRGSHSLQRNNSKTHSKGDDQLPFKRSRKMKYKISRGRPATNFLVKKKRD